LKATEERASEVCKLLDRVRNWVACRPDVVAASLVGSWVRGEARIDSEVDIVLPTTKKEIYLKDESWVRELGGLRIVKTQEWGPTTERRFVLSSGLQVEVGVAPPSWAATDPVDPGTRKVVRDGMSILYDPRGLLERLAAAC
jgi:predicted nucleotidyltransferase